MNERIIYRNYHWFDPSGEETFLLSEPPKELKVGKRSLRRCALLGGKNPRTGETCYLRVCLLPGGMGTTVEEYQRWLSRRNSDGS